MRLGEPEPGEACATRTDGWWSMNAQCEGRGRRVLRSRPALYVVVRALRRCSGRSGAFADAPSPPSSSCPPWPPRSPAPVPRSSLSVPPLPACTASGAHFSLFFHNLLPLISFDGPANSPCTSIVDQFDKSFDLGSLLFATRACGTNSKDTLYCTKS